MDQEYRISKLGGGIAIGIALTLDLIQLGLNLTIIGGLVSPIIYFIALMSFGTWFIFKKVKLFGLKTGLWFLVISLIEFIPYLNLLPGLTVMVTRNILNARLEDLNKKSIV